MVSSTVPRLEDRWPPVFDTETYKQRNVVERAVALSGSGPFLDARDIWLSSLELDGPAPLAPAVAVYRPVSIEELEKEHILHTLQHTEWNKSQAAAILHIERSTLDRKIKAYELKR